MSFPPVSSSFPRACILHPWQEHPPLTAPSLLLSGWVWGRLQSLCSPPAAAHLPTWHCRSVQLQHRGNASPVLLLSLPSDNFHEASVCHIPPRHRAAGRAPVGCTAGDRGFGPEDSPAWGKCCSILHTDCEYPPFSFLLSFSASLGFAQPGCSEGVDEQQDTRVEGSRRWTPMLKSSLNQEGGDENIPMDECLRGSTLWFFAKSRTSLGSITPPLAAF